METTTNIILVAVGFILVSTGVVLHKKRRLLYLFVSLGLVLFTVPFARHWYLTRDAFEWTIVVERTIGDTDEPRVIYVERIEWITDYEVLKRQRGHVRSLILNKETTRKEWSVRGYVPLAIRAEILLGSDEIAISRNFADLPPGAYTFVLSFDERNIGTWSVAAHDSDGRERAIE